MISGRTSAQCCIDAQCLPRDRASWSLSAHDPHLFAVLTSRVGDGGNPPFSGLEERVEQPRDFLVGNGEGRTLGVLDVHEENCQEGAVLRQGGVDGADIFSPARGIDGTEKSVLEHPVKGPSHRAFQLEEIAEEIGLAADPLLPVGPIDGNRGDIETEGFSAVASEETHVVAKPAAGYEDLSGDLVIRQKLDQRGSRRPLFPGRVARSVALVPVSRNGSCSYGV